MVAQSRKERLERAFRFKEVCARILSLSTLNWLSIFQASINIVGASVYQYLMIVAIASKRFQLKHANLDAVHKYEALPRRHMTS